MFTADASAKMIYVVVNGFEVFLDDSFEFSNE